MSEDSISKNFNVPSAQEIPAEPQNAAPTVSLPKINKLGLSRVDYQGAASTLCSGCGHDTITNNIISALYLSSIDPYSIAKMSGIGCSSKTPAYFLNKSAGFNSIHGRMASCSTGVKVANTSLSILGISGDGDSASIGLGGLVHLMRRNLPMAYIVENNGVYGLTKGQFSATADFDSVAKSGDHNPFEGIDLCALAVEMGCTFVARSFSGDAKQLVPLIQAGLRHKGTAFIDVISPCVTFANHEGSTKSYNAVRDHKVALQELGFIQEKAEIKVDYEEGAFETVTLPDGSYLTLRKLDSRAHDIRQPIEALKVLHEARAKGEILTGLFYVNEEKQTLLETLGLAQKPLAFLTAEECRLSPSDFNEVLQNFK